MARESKAKRDAKRFGVSDRLADDIVSQWSNEPKGERRQLQAEGISCSQIIEATPVSEYFYGITREQKFNILDGLPCLRMPFPEIFIEMFQDYCGEITAGWHLMSVPPSFVSKLVAAKYFEDVEVDEVDASENIFATFSAKVRGMLVGPIAASLLTVGRDGKLTQNPAVRVHDGRGTDSTMEQIIVNSLIPSCLTLCFMNCKNVTVAPIDRSQAINNERRKAGLKPFLRYHTININPMKEVLRTEGGIETNGLKKALHICRGHFATYSEDKPLFGHFTGTVWKPAHVRGSAKQGVVVSDYKVNAPQPRAAQ